MAYGHPHDPINDLLRVDLVLERFEYRRFFSPAALATMRMDRHDFVMRQSEEFAVALTGMVATWRKERILHVPANWWEHLKQRWFPRWALRRWPVLTTSYDAIVYLPGAPIIPASIHFEVLRESP